MRTPVTIAMILIILIASSSSFAWDTEVVCAQTARHYRDGVGAFRAGDLGQSERDLVAACSLSPYYTDAVIALANVYMAMAKYDSAAIYYRRAVGLRPGSSRAYMGLGTAALYEGDYETAVGAYKEAIAANYNNALAFLCLGKAYKHMGQDGNAKVSLAIAKELYESKGNRKVSEKIGAVLSDKRMGGAATD